MLGAFIHALSLDPQSNFVASINLASNVKVRTLKNKECKITSQLCRADTETAKLGRADLHLIPMTNTYIMVIVCLVTAPQTPPYS